MLGISVYFKDLDYNYLHEVLKNNIKYVFTSLQIPEENLFNLEDELPIFIDFINKHNLSLIPDISPLTFEKLNIKNNDFQKLKELGFKSIRLDYGIDDIDTIKSLQEHFEIILNASIVDENYIISLINNGIDITKIKVLHNFYPKTNTGLSIEYFNKRNEVFKKYNINIMAFISGDMLKRFPLYEGLVTLEKHREVNPYVAYIELINKFNVSDVIIGDSKASLKVLSYINEYYKNKVLTLPALLNDKTLYNKEFKIRKDMSDKVIRIISDRTLDIPILNNNHRYIGTITQSNKLANRYSGEIQICKCDIPMDARENVLGVIHIDYIELLNYIDSSIKVKFVEV